MSSTMKLSLLALVSTVAAIPHYGAHSKFHSLKPTGTEGYGHGHHGTGRPYPTGGFQGYNSTVVPYPTDTGDYDDDTKTIDVTSTSTLTITSTIHVKPSSAPAAASSVAGDYQASGVAVAQNVPTTEGGKCPAPRTVTVTADETVTMTVGEGDYASYTPAPQSSAAPVESKPGNGYSPPSSANYVLASSAPPAPPAEKPSTPAVQYPAETPKAQAPSSSKVEVYVAPSSVVQKQPVYSSAAPSATPPATGNSYSGIKRGLAYNDAALCKSLSSTAKYGFAHNWGQTESNDIGAMFIPTIPAPNKGTPSEWMANVDKAVKKGSTAVQGFNECDQDDQCALSPEAACASWKEFMNPVKAAYPQVTILGPSITNGGAPKGFTWLTQFNTVCPDAAVDATNIHFYDIYQEANPSIGQSSTIDRFKQHVEEAASNYGKKVWITEFGFLPGQATPDQAGKFLKDAMAYLDSADHVQGYSWFKVGTGATDLNESALGQAYATTS